MQKSLQVQAQPPGREGPLEEGMATQSNVLVWRLPSTEELGGLQSIGPQRVRHDGSDLAGTHVHMPPPS